jgi:hypothetical protein
MERARAEVMTTAAVEAGPLPPNGQLPGPGKAPVMRRDRRIVSDGEGAWRTGAWKMTG